MEEFTATVLLILLAFDLMILALHLLLCAISAIEQKLFGRFR